MRTVLNVTKISRITRISRGARHLETGTEDVSDEVDKLERESPPPKEAVLACECQKQEMLLYQHSTRPEESSQMGCRIDDEQENNTAACSNGNDTLVGL